MATIKIEDPVIIEDTAPEGHAEAVAAAFNEAGFDVQVEAAMGRRSADVLPWIVQVAVGGTLAGFFGALGADAYGRFKKLVHDILQAREGAGNGRGSIQWGDEQHTWIHMESDNIPDEALDALADLDWGLLRGGYLVWRSDLCEWLDHDRRD